MHGLDILLIALIVASLPVCIWKPWIGVLVFSWLGCMHPHRLVGGLAYGLPFSKVVAAATLAGLVFTKERYRLPRCREVYLLGALWIIFLASTTFAALEPAAAWTKFAEVSKVLAMTVVTMMLFQERRKLHALLLVIALSIGVYGITGGVWGLETGLQERLFGPPGSTIEDNNALGFAFTMILPLLALLRREHPADPPDPSPVKHRVANGALRWLLLITFGLSIVALFATYSRGAFVGFWLVLPLIALQVRTKDLPLLGVGLAACLVIYFAPQEWVERMETITPTAYRTQSSGVQRMKAWYVAYRLGLDHPLLGAGFYPFSSNVYEHYLPGYLDSHDSHNHFLQVLAEHGITGLLLYVGLMACVAYRLWCLAWRARRDRGDEWIARYAQMIGSALVAFIVGGAFINMPYFDLYFDFVALAVVLGQIAVHGGSGCPLVGEPLIVAAAKRARAALRLA